jgi:hypothetical protein
MKNIFVQLLNTFRFISFLLTSILKKSYRNKLEMNCEGTLTVFANGPSLREDLKELDKSGFIFSNADYLVVNFFAFDSNFMKIKPRHYCLADPMFFADSLKTKDVQKLYVLFEKYVNWEMFLYIPVNRFNDFIKYSKITNTNIKVIKLNVNSYSGYEKFRYFFYKKGLAMPTPQTVANFAIFVGLNRGYKELKLYGFDHTFFDSLQVNDKNQLCNKELHFYNKEATLKPILKIFNGEQYKISDYLKDITNMFASHDLLNCYAEYLDVKILNCTKNSMIDSYCRK